MRKFANYFVLLVVALMLSTDGDITGKDSTDGVCLCVTERFNLRMAGKLKLQTQCDIVT